MRFTKLPVRRAGLVALCLSLLISFAAAQTLPLLRSGAQPSPSTAPSTQRPAAVPSPTPSRGGRRDLTRYEKAAPLSLRADVEGPERDALLAPARAFLLGHWRRHQLGQVVVEYADADGRPLSSSSLYVETDAAGRWCVVVETEGVTATYRSVEEVETSEEGTPILSPAEEAARRPGVRALHLKESPEANSGVVF